MNNDSQNTSLISQVSGYSLAKILSIGSFFALGIASFLSPAHNFEEDSHSDLFVADFTTSINDLDTAPQHGIYGAFWSDNNGNRIWDEKNLSIPLSLDFYSLERSSSYTFSVDQTGVIKESNIPRGQYLLTIDMPNKYHVTSFKSEGGMLIALQDKKYILSVEEDLFIFAFEIGVMAQKK